MLRTRLVTLITTLFLRKVGTSSPPLRPLTVSSSVHRLREEMGNQVSNKGHDPTYKAEEEAPAPEITFTEEELRSKLTAEEYRVTQEKGMDQAFVSRSFR